MLRLSKDEFSRMFGTKEKKRSKYGNKKCEWMGFEFDSKKERDRFIILDAAQRDGEISGLQRQVKFVLIPDQYIDGKLVERSMSYIADFTYRDKQGNMIVEDVKGLRTKEYINKRKTLLWLYGIRIHEI